MPDPIDDRIISAVRQALAKTLERPSQRTEYFKEVLQLESSERKPELTSESPSNSALSAAMLKTLDTSPMSECRALIKQLDEESEIKLASVARERLANRWKAITQQPVASFLRELPENDLDTERDFGDLVGVQTDLDGVWSNGKGTADNWTDWIIRKQNDYRVGRLHMLFEAA